MSCSRSKFQTVYNIFGCNFIISGKLVMDVIISYVISIKRLSSGNGYLGYSWVLQELYNQRCTDWYYFPHHDYNLLPLHVRYCHINVLQKSCSQVNTETQASLELLHILNLGLTQKRKSKATCSVEWWTTEGNTKSIHQLIEKHFLYKIC